ncbi:SRPBCC family protein [Streptomyces argenteolus]|uniref:SRPBCC family protein n=1 Tax=Streptomyces sp. NPDC025273 TaxID=3155251 RepID=UPI00340B358C
MLGDRAEGDLEAGRDAPRGQLVVPRDRVATYAADPSHAPEWYANIDSVAWQTPPPVAIGSRIAFTARFLGRRLAYTYEITAYEPGRRLVMRTGEGPFPHGDHVRVGTARGSRRAHPHDTAKRSPAASPHSPPPAITSAMRHAQSKDLARLKALLDQQV